MDLADGQVGRIGRHKQTEHGRRFAGPIAVAPGAGSDDRFLEYHDRRPVVYLGRRTEAAASRARIGPVGRIVDRPCGCRNRQAKPRGHATAILIELGRSQIERVDRTGPGREPVLHGLQARRPVGDFVSHGGLIADRGRDRLDRGEHILVRQHRRSQFSPAIDVTLHEVGILEHAAVPQAIGAVHQAFGRGVGKAAEVGVPDRAHRQLAAVVGVWIINPHGS